jgi:hypothetical protein
LEDRLRPCRSAPVGASRPPPAPAGAISFSARCATASSGCAAPPQAPHPQGPPSGPRSPAPVRASGDSTVLASVACLAPVRPGCGQRPGISVGESVFFVVTSWWRSRPAGPSTTQQGDERFRLRWLIQEKRAEGGGRNLVKMRPQNTSANSNSTVKVPRTALALAA